MDCCEEISESLDELFEQNNRLKNRYFNIGAIGRSRIRIISAKGTEEYINANYIDVRFIKKKLEIYVLQLKACKTKI